MLEALDDHAGAAQQYLCTAWTFDDERNTLGACIWRKAAIKQAEAALADTATHAGTLTMLADMLRRNGEFETVLQMQAPFGLARESSRLLDFQKTLARVHDAEVHTMDEIPGYKPDMGGTFFNF